MTKISPAYVTLANLSNFNRITILIEVIFLNFNQLEFVRGLVQLAVEKLCNDIDEITDSEHLFAHLIDETLSFEQEVRDTLGYPSNYCSAITVLTQAKYLTKWLAIEEQCKPKMFIFNAIFY